MNNNKIYLKITSIIDMNFCRKFYMQEKFSTTIITIIDIRNLINNRRR